MSGAIAGAELGGEIGAFGGPVGAAAGVVVGGLVGLGLTIWAAHAISQANQKADDKLSDKAKDEPCAECGEVGCFNTPEGGDKEEMARQLKDQQDAINDMSPDDVLKKLEDFDAGKRPNDGAPRARLRRQIAKGARTKASTQAIQDGLSPAEASEAGDKAAGEALAGKDVLHTPDFSAAGTGRTSGLGDSSINRSIGPQWSGKAPGSTSARRDELRKAAAAAKKAGKKMSIKLETCD